MLPIPSFVSALILSSLVGILPLVKAQSGVISILGSDTVWTKANSPYSLAGPVVISEGVTLTIQAGATVNLNSYYITVNGTLRAIGNSADPIHFNGGNITFTGYSNAWNEQTGSGCIIENAVLISTSLYGGSVKINNNSINAAVSGGSSVI